MPLGCLCGSLTACPMLLPLLLILRMRKSASGKNSSRAATALVSDSILVRRCASIRGVRWRCGSPCAHANAAYNESSKQRPFEKTRAAACDHFQSGAASVRELHTCGSCVQQGPACAHTAGFNSGARAVASSTPRPHGGTQSDTAPRERVCDVASQYNQRDAARMVFATAMLRSPMVPVPA